MVDIYAYNNTAYDRNTHVTLGVPFAEGELTTSDSLVVDGATSNREFAQWYPQGARWNDNSVKYARVTFPISISSSVEKSVILSKATNGTSSSFSVPIQTDIDNTTIQLRMRLKRFYLELGQITSWGPSPVANRTRITFSGIAIEAYDQNYPETLERMGWLSNGTYFNSRLFNVGNTGAGVYSSSRIKTYWVDRNTIDLDVYDPAFTPTLTSQSYLQPGLWKFAAGASYTTIDCDLSTATLVESGSDTSKIHYKRYKVFSRASTADDLWAEVVFDVYKNSRRIKFWYSWGNSYVATGYGVTRRPGSYFSYYFDGAVELIVKRTTSTGTTPRVGIEGREYKTYSYTESAGQTSFEILNSNRDAVWTTTNSSGATVYNERVNRDLIPNSFSMHYKGVILWPSGPLTNSDNGELTGDAVYAIADNWNRYMPPYFHYPDMPTIFSSRSAGVTAMIADFARYHIPGFKVGYPIQLGNMSFGPLSRPGAAGEQHLSFVSLPGHWMIATSHAYPIKWLSIQCSQEALRTIWRIRGDGEEWDPGDHGYPLNTNDWRWHKNTTDFGGNGANEYTINTDPAPVLQGISPNRFAGTSWDELYAYDSANNKGGRVTGCDKAHWSVEWQYLYAMVSMDYLGLKHCSWISKAFVTDHWSSTSAPPWVYTTKEVSRAIGRPTRCIAFLLELIDDSTALTEVLGRILLMQSEPGHGGYYADARYPEHADDYTVLKPYRIDSPTDGRTLIQEYYASGWMDMICAGGIYALYEVLRRRSSVSSTYTDILYKIVKDLCATSMLYHLIDTDERNEVTMARVDVPISSGLAAAYPETDFCVAGDVLELANDPSVYFTVTLVSITDDSPYNTTTTPWTLTSEYRIGVSFFVKDINNPSRLANFRNLRNRRTGRLLQTGTGTLLSINKAYKGFKTNSSYATTPENGVEVDDPEFVGGNAPNYLMPIDEETLFSEAATYVHDPTVRNSNGNPTTITYVRGNQIKPYTSGVARYWIFVDSVIYWGIGAITIAKKLAADNAFGAENSAIRDKADAAYAYFLDLYNNYSSSNWENDFGCNLFLVQVDSTNSGNIRKNLSTLVIRAKIFSVGAEGEGGGTPNISVSRSLSAINIATEAQGVGVRTTNGNVDFYRKLSTSHKLKVRVYPVTVNIEADVAYALNTLDVAVQIQSPSAKGYGGVVRPNMQTNSRRRIRLIFGNEVDDELPAGVFGAQANNGSEGALSEKEWIILAEYVSENDILTKYGYPSTDLVQPGFFLEERQFIPYYLYVEENPDIFDIA